MLRFLIPILATLACQGIAPAEDGTKWRGPLGTGVYPDETGWRFDWSDAGPALRWKVDVGLGYSGIAVSDDRAYTVGNTDGEDTIYCLDAETGATIWQVGYPQELIRTAVAGRMADENGREFRRPRAL